MDPYCFPGSDFGICIAQKQETFENQALVIVDVKKYLHWSMIGKITLSMERIQVKLGLLAAGKCDSFNALLFYENS